jgi:hypothetical protein
LELTSLDPQLWIDIGIEQFSAELFHDLFAGARVLRGAFGGNFAAVEMQRRMGGYCLNLVGARQDWGRLRRDEQFKATSISYMASNGVSQG